MITYKFDEKLIYSDDILRMLRLHNKQYTENKEHETTHMYILDNDHLIAALTVNYNWDWVSIGSLYYNDIVGLKHILKAVIDKYKDRAVGIKFFTNDQNRLVDFISIGFEAAGVYTDDVSHITWYYANFYTFDITIDVTHKIIVSSEKIDAYDSILATHVKQYNKEHNIKDKTSSFNIVAMDKNTCIGGVMCDVYDTTLYIPYLALNKTYRKRGIGSELMTKVEEEAKKRHIHMIDLGTSDFQAKGFYEKLGYDAVYTQKNQPRGYNTHTMIKIIK